MVVLVASMLVFMASTVTAQATDTKSLSAIQSLGNSLAAPALGAPAASTVYLPLVIRGAGTPTPPGPEGALFLNRTIKTDSASAAVDAAGGFHLAYVKSGALVDGIQAYYSYCPATVDCTIASNWVTVILSDRVEEVQLALTKGGHPRLLLRGPNPDVNTYFYKYAACDINCTTIAGWTIADVVPTFTEPPYWGTFYSLRHYFALDNLDRPRFLYAAGWEAFYVYCDSACTSAANWWKYPINKDIFGSDLPTLTFTSLGQPRITATISDSTTGDSYLNYITCDALCDNLANWTNTRLMDRGGGIYISFVLRLTSNDQPRLVFNQGSMYPGPSNYLWYLWCNTGCTNGANWAGSSVGAPGQTEDADLALDVLNRPRIAFKDNSPNGLGYVWCDTNCESNTAIWQGGLVEPSTDLDVEWPLPPLDCTDSYWYGGYRPSLALDLAGNPRIGYVAQHLVQYGSSCTVHEDYRAVRFIFFNQP